MRQQIFSGVPFMSQDHGYVVQAALELTGNPSLCFISTLLRLELYSICHA